MDTTQENYITRYNDLSEQIEKAWTRLKVLVDLKDKSRIDELRIAVVLLKQLLVRQHMLNEGEKLEVTN